MINLSPLSYKGISYPPTCMHATSTKFYQLTTMTHTFVLLLTDVLHVIYTEVQVYSTAWYQSYSALINDKTTFHTDAVSR